MVLNLLLEVDFLESLQLMQDLQPLQLVQAQKVLQLLLELQVGYLESLLLGLNPPLGPPVEVDFSPIQLPIQELKEGFLEISLPHKEDFLENLQELKPPQPL